MENLTMTKLLLHYFRDKRNVIFMFILYQLTFCFICMLYQLDHFSKLLYAVWICVFISLCWGMWDFIKYRKNIHQISEAYINVEDISRLLP